jgi:hypothetical protein
MYLRNIGKNVMQIKDNSIGQYTFKKSKTKGMWLYTRGMSMLKINAVKACMSNGLVVWQTHCALQFANDTR